MSLVSGRECAQALRDVGYDVIEIDAGKDLAARLLDVAPDVVFNALHGRWGEDGAVQGLLEWLRIPYTHSGVLASALAMDKIKAKQAFANAGWPVAESLLAPAADVQTAHPMTPPYVVKPYNEGSSVGVYIVHESANGPAKLGPEMQEMVMVERFIPGRELTTAVVAGRALTVTDIFTDGWYDFHAKYAEGGSDHVVPANIPEDIFALCLDYAGRAHECLGCRGATRTDFRWDESRGRDGLFLLETNTQPGMTPTSLLPEQAMICGMEFGALLTWMVEDASCDR